MQESLKDKGGTLFKLTHIAKYWMTEEQLSAFNVLLDSETLQITFNLYKNVLSEL